MAKTAQIVAGRFTNLLEIDCERRSDGYEQDRICCSADSDLYGAVCRSTECVCHEQRATSSNFACKSDPAYVRSDLRYILIAQRRLSHSETVYKGCIRFFIFLVKPRPQRESVFESLRSLCDGWRGANGRGWSVHRFPE